EPNGSNLLLQAVLRDGISISHRLGTVDLAGETRSDIPVVTFRRKDVSQADFATLLYPFRGKADPDAVSAREFAVENGCGCVVRAPGRMDVVVWLWEEGKASLARDVFSFEGRACLARVHDGSFSLVGGRLLRLQGRTLMASHNPVPELCVEYRDDAVVVTCPVSEPTLEIAALGRKWALVNGKRVFLDGGCDTFRPFAGR
ncbi:MAG: hypothetical protein ACP5R5_14870, partial [Armatimonadota bacterium]